ncbi:MAG: cobalamin-binding protein [Thermoplasmata archaeon]|nr:cobalamin-binding protein [Thermoplasmata archaeon]
MRIVSLLPSATEMVVALGRGRDLVGRSSECDFPGSVRKLPAVMRARAWDGDRPSAEIDDRVRSTRSAGESLYILDVPLLARLRPDVILTQDLCGVCSVADAEVAAACRLAGVDPQIVSLTPRTLAEVADTIEAVGRAIGAPIAGRRLGATLRSRPAPPSPSKRPLVAVVEWLDPPILAGLWTPEIIERAGGSALGPRPGAVGHRTTWAAIHRSHPSLVVVAPCSFSVARTARELSDSPWGNRLVGRGAERGVWLADEAYFSRPGPRLAHGISLVRSLLKGGVASPPMPIQRWDPPPPTEEAER